MCCFSIRCVCACLVELYRSMFQNLARVTRASYTTTRRQAARSQATVSIAYQLGPPSSHIILFFLLSQRNVGILEKIVQALSSSRGDDELSMQYQAQVDVIKELQEKIGRLLQQTKTTTNSTQKTAAIKLQRDFERVQTRATSLQDTGAKLLKSKSKANASSATQLAIANNKSTQESTQMNTYQQQQIQLQHDVSLKCQYECMVAKNSGLDILI